MNLQEILGGPLGQRLAWTLLHFLWQGLLISAGAAAAGWLLSPVRTRGRYVVALAGLVLMACCPLVTFGVLQVAAPKPTALAAVPEVPTIEPQPPAMDQMRAEGFAMPAPSRLARVVAAEPSISPAPESAPIVIDWRTRLARVAASIQPYAIAAWLAGVVLLSGRLLASVLGVSRLARRRLPVSADVAACAARLAQRLGLSDPPGVYLSERIREAMLVGLLRPMVLLPAAWIAEMPPDVLEAVIAHELAHVRRLDLWANLLQRLVETLLFYHPAVWWLSRRASLLREMCADELAVQATGQRLTYAGVLEHLGRRRLRLPTPQLAAGIGGPRMALLDRVRNVMGVAPGRERLCWWPAGLLALLVPLGLWLVSIGTAQSQPRSANSRAIEPAASDKKAESGVVRGRVVDASNRAAIDGAVIHAQSIVPHVGEAGFRRVVSDKDGRFAIDRMTPGLWNILLGGLPGKPNWTAAAAEAVDVKPSETITVELRAAPGRKVSGRVIDAVKHVPLAGVSVGCYGAARPNSGAECMMVKTDVKGQFTFHVPPGETHVYVAQEFSGKRERTFIVEPKVDPDPIVFQGALPGPGEPAGYVVAAAGGKEENKDYTLSGTLRSADGKPVPSATVRIWTLSYLGPEKTGYLDIESAVVNEGKFDLFLGIRFFDEKGRRLVDKEREYYKPLIGETWYVTVDAPGFARPEPVKFTFDKEIKPLAIILDRPRYVLVRGRVIGPDGRPAAKANVAVSLSTVGDAVECPWGPEYLTDKDGRFEIKHVYVGNRIAIETEQGPLKAVSTRMLVQNAEPLDLGDLRLKTASSRQSVRTSAAKPADELPPASGKSATKEVARLQRIWKGWSDTVRSMEVEGHKFIGESGRNGLSHDTVERIIFDTVVPNIKPGATSLETLNSLTSPVFSNKWADRQSRPIGIWRHFTLVEDSGALRVDELIDGLMQVTVRKEGQEQQYWEGTKQVSLFSAQTGLQVESIKTFLPDYNLPKEKNLEWKLTQAYGDQTRRLEYMDARGAGIVLEYDGTTGFVQRYAMRLAKNYISELVQSRPMMTSLGIPIPRIVIRLRFSGSPKNGTVVSGITMDVLDEVHVNRSVNPSRFQISAPAGTNIVKFDGGDQHPSASGKASRRPAEQVNRPVADTEQAKAIAKIKKLGGKVTVDEKSPGKPVIGVDFNHTKVTDAALAYLEKLTRLRRLSLDGSQVTDAGLGHLKRLNQLESLLLRNTQVTDAGLAQIQGLSQLHTLWLDGDKVSDAGLEHLQLLSHLQELWLSQTQVTDAGLRYLKTLTRLQGLYLRDTKVTDAGLKHLKELEQLRVLGLGGTTVTDTGLQQLKGLKQLQILELGDTHVNDAGLEHLKALSHLQQLDLNDTQVAGVGLAQLKGLNQLHMLRLDGTKVNDAGLEYLTQLSQLQVLWLMRTNVTDEGVKKLQQALPNCKINYKPSDEDPAPGTAEPATGERISVPDRMLIKDYYPRLTLPSPGCGRVGNPEDRKKLGITAEQEKKLHDASVDYIAEFNKLGPASSAVNEVRWRVDAILTPEQLETCRKAAFRQLAFEMVVDPGVAGPNFRNAVGTTPEQERKLRQLRQTAFEEAYQKPSEQYRAILSPQQWEKLMAIAERAYRMSLQPGARIPQWPPQWPVTTNENSDWSWWHPSDPTEYIHLTVYKDLGKAWVRNRLGLSDVQVKQLRGISAKCETPQQLWNKTSDRLSSDERQKQFYEFQEQATRKAQEIRPQIEALLTPQQLTALKEVEFWPEIVGQLTQPQVQNEVALSEEQSAALKRVNQEARKRVADFEGEVSDKAIGLLTPDQRAKLRAVSDRRGY